MILALLGEIAIIGIIFYVIGAMFLAPLVVSILKIIGIIVGIVFLINIVIFIIEKIKKSGASGKKIGYTILTIYILSNIIGTIVLIIKHPEIFNSLRTLFQ